jgi:hypothetical protein
VLAAWLAVRGEYCPRSVDGSKGDGQLCWVGLTRLSEDRFSGMVASPVLECAFLGHDAWNATLLSASGGLSLSAAGSSRGCPVSSQGQGEPRVPPWETGDLPGNVRADYGTGSLWSSGACRCFCQVAFVCSSQRGFLLIAHLPVDSWLIIFGDSPSQLHSLSLRNGQGLLSIEKIV